MNPEQMGLWAGLILSLMIFSYLLGDNFLYRLAVHIFVGLAAGFVAVVTVESVLVPWINTTVLAPDSNIGIRIVGIIPLLLGFLLLLKSSPRLGRLGNLAIAFVIGVGSAVAVVGAISGTLLPLAGETSANINADLLNGFLIVLGVISSLVYFQYLAQRTPGGGTRRALHVRFLSAIGQGFIVVTLGALYAGAILTSLTIFSERVAFILTRIGGG
jgi:hypothetical protein